VQSDDAAEVADLKVMADADVVIHARVGGCLLNSAV
jgi:hypothetical protein